MVMLSRANVVAVFAGNETPENVPRIAVSPSVTVALMT